MDGVNETGKSGCCWTHRRCSIVDGLGILAVYDEEEVKSIAANDPTVKINRCEYHSMIAITPTEDG